MVSAIVVVVVPVWATALINMGAVVEVLVIDARGGAVVDTLADIEIIVLAAVMIVLEFAVSASYLVDALSVVVVVALVDVVAGPNASQWNAKGVQHCEAKRSQLPRHFRAELVSRVSSDPPWLQTLMLKYGHSARPE